MTLNAVTDDFVNVLRGEIPAAAFKATAPLYLEDPRGITHGTAGQVVAPATVAQVSAIVTLANAARVAIVPFGGGTGLVGAQLMPNGPAPPMPQSGNRRLPPFTLGANDDGIRSECRKTRTP